MALYFIVGTVPRCDTFANLAVWLSQVTEDSEATMNCHTASTHRQPTEDVDRFHKPSCACEIFHLSSVWIEQDLRPVLQEAPQYFTMHYGHVSLLGPMEFNLEPSIPPPEFFA